MRFPLLAGCLFITACTGTISEPDSGNIVPVDQPPSGCKMEQLLADKCIASTVPNAERCAELAESSPSIVTPLNKYIGYENAAKVAKTALKDQKTIRQTVLDMGFVDDGKLTIAQLDAALDVLSMTHP
jgi:fumarate hydratase class II